MQAIAPYTKLKPSERMEEAEGIIEDFKKFQIKIDAGQKIKAYQLVQPEVKVQGSNVIKNQGDG